MCVCVGKIFRMQTQFAHMNSAIKYFWSYVLLLLFNNMQPCNTREFWNIIKFSYSIDCSRAQRNAIYSSALNVNITHTQRWAASMQTQAGKRGGEGTAFPSHTGPIQLES